MQSKYNLMRGNIAEMMIDEILDPSMIGLDGFTKIQIGLVVKDITEKSIGCSPDMILVSEDEIIPVEIKSLHTSRKNNDYYRGLKLALRQCDGLVEILLSFGITKSVINRKLVIISWFDDDFLELECILYHK